MVSDTDNRIARLTPSGKGGIATLAVEGADAWEALRSLFRRPGGVALAEAKEGDLLVGKLGPTDAVADDVVVAVTRLSPTLNVEIHCHGGPAVVGLIEELFQEKGFRVVDWPALMPKEEAGLLEALSRAPTLRTASILLDQWRGAFGRLLERLEREPGNAHELGERFLKWEKLGRHLVEPWKVVIAGAPNVGKSSLMNAIAGYRRSVVSATPGTTRDVVSTSLAIDGWPVALSDTAGVRPGGDELEEAGIERARETLERVDLVLWVVEAGGVADWPQELATPLVRVVNKVDLAPDLPREEDNVYVSARTGEGLVELLRRLSAALVPESPEPGDAVPVDEWQLEQVRTLLKQIDEPAQ